jgi:hypothetical protein
LLVAVQAQPDAIATGKAIANPPLLGTTFGLPTDALQGTPAWLTTNVTPATVSVPVRELGLVFGATE